MGTHTILNIKTDKKLKAEAKQVAEELGIPLGTILNAYLRHFVRERAVFFSASQYRQTPYLEKCIKEAQEEYERGESAGPFETVDELLEALNKESDD